ncbi:MAG: dTDP-4-dehydrorhamnose reductase [Oceanospirillaceae bacterium]|nr:dTDP-4-dehydrorhamnose reductase [Oceanospirillaceae bacterium]
MRVLITGAKGQVGSELLRQSPAVFETTGMGSADLDISNADEVARMLERLRPELIINAAAYTAVDKAESDSDRAYAVNQEAVLYLAQAAEKAEIPIFHLSTDYVFPGTSRGPYSESDSPAPKSVYGASKLAGERVLAEHCSRHMILRTSWVFGASGNNFVKTMLRLGRERDELSVVADQRGGPTSARSIAEALWRLARHYAENASLPWGIYHFSGAPACSWNEFAVEVFAQATQEGLLTAPPRVAPITTEQYPTTAKRPANSELDCSKIKLALGISQPDWRVELRSVLKELKTD